MALEGLLTPREPLGPIDQANIRADADIDEILNANVTPFSEALSRVPILLLGRKGSGKSSILAEFKIQARRGDGRIIADQPPNRGAPFLISVDSWDHFHQLTRHVAKQFRDSNPEFDSELVPTEYLAQLWKEAIWDDIILFFYNFCHHKESRAALVAVERYVLADGRFVGPPGKAAKLLFEAAKAAVLAYAVSRKSKIVFLIDSMEKYPVRNEVFSQVLGGLLQAVNSVHYDSEFLSIIFCLPEEIESHLRNGSHNIMKDYNAAYRIRWKPIDLLKVAAHRYRLFAKLQDSDLYALTKDFNLDARDGIHDFFGAVMPSTFFNSMGEPEDPIAYIVRHTQLLPRHIIAVFNAIIARSVSATKQFRRLDEQSIREGILDAEKLVAQQILVPFYRIYPDLIACCEEVLPDLSPVCTFNDLKRIERRFARRVEDDVRDIWRALFGMGVLGKVVPSPEGEPPSFARGSRYCLAQFHYNIEGAFGLSTDAEYCFHPVFSRHFGISRKNGDDKRAIYPAHVDMVTLR